MTIEELQEKIKLAEEKIAKIEKTIEKYNVQREKKIQATNKILEQNGISERYNDFKDSSNVRYRYDNTSFHHDYYWSICDIEDKDEGINSNNKKLEEAKQSLENWKAKLRQEEVKLQYIQDSVPEVIKIFLNDWKSRVIDYYTKKAEAYPEALKEYRENKSRVYFEVLVETVNKLKEELGESEFIQKYCYGNDYRYHSLLSAIDEGYVPNNDYLYSNMIRFSYKDPNDPDKNPKYLRIIEEWKSKYGDGFFQSWLARKFDPEWLEKEIEQEKNNKLIDLMNRVSSITGVITDASYLTIKEGNLNGYIIGKDGKAEVETIGAGGWNVQIFHYRTLIKKIK